MIWYQSSFEFSLINLYTYKFIINALNCGLWNHIRVIVLVIDEGSNKKKTHAEIEKKMKDEQSFTLGEVNQKGAFKQKDITSSARRLNYEEIKNCQTKNTNWRKISAFL